MIFTLTDLLESSKYTTGFGFFQNILKGIFAVQVEDMEVSIFDKNIIMGVRQ